MNDSEIFSQLLSRLWEQYKKRVPYAAAYQRMVEERGGQLQNDHLAFRTLNCPTGDQPQGVEAIARVFRALGYEQKDQYLFEDKHLTAWHYEHKTDARNPKIFISQLEVSKLDTSIAKKIKEAVQEASDGIKGVNLSDLSRTKDASALVDQLFGYFTRPWSPPPRRLVEESDPHSQYAAWTLLHGNSVNHFTAYINEQRVKDWPDIEATVLALKDANVPMKADFEGARGSKLRQSSTKASLEKCDVREMNGSLGKIDWSYAYYELAERGDVDDGSGKRKRFQGFLGAQATNLFEMTKRS